MNINIVIGIFFVFIIPAVCLSLLIRVLYLQNILSQKKKARAYFETKREEAGNARKYAKSEISRAPSNFYSAKSSCMTKNESLMFYYLNTALTDLIPNPWERKNYYVFPQVSLYSLVRIRDELKTRSQHGQSSKTAIFLKVLILLSAIVTRSAICTSTNRFF